MQVSGIAAIVTGGASGLGAATAHALAEDGAQVYGIDLPQVIEQAEPPQFSGEGAISYCPADVTDPAQVSEAVRQATAGTAPLRVVVNCAGVGTAGRVLGKNGPHDLEAFRRVVEINLIGTFNVLRLGAEAIAATPELADGQRGVIINTASIAAFEGQIGQAAYAASKGGVVGLGVPAARDLSGSGVRVMTIAPGIVDTPMLAGVDESFREALGQGVPFPKRLGTPEEYAKLARSIIDQDYLNGEVIRLDGALRMGPR